MGTRRRLARGHKPVSRVTNRPIMSLLDQAFSSASNIFILLTVARVSDVADFGRIALMLIFATTGVAVSRGGIGTPLMLMSGRDAKDIEYAARRSLTASLVFGALTSLAILIFGATIGYLNIALPVALAVPFVIMEDIYRFASMALGRVSSALLWDAVWTGISLCVLCASWLGFDSLTGQVVLGIWGATAFLCCIGFAVTSNLLPRRKDFRQWWVDNLQSRIRFALDASTSAATVLGVSLLAATLVSPTATAALRGAGTILGPLNILLNAVPLMVIPHAVRTGQSLQQVWRTLRRYATSLSLLALMGGALGYLLPLRVGELLLGQSWPSVRLLLPYTALEYAAAAWWLCVLSAFSAQAMSQQVLRARATHAAISVALCAAAALTLPKAEAVAAALAVSQVGALLISGNILRKHLRA
jgi:hypothetical protein